MSLEDQLGAQEFLDTPPESLMTPAQKLPLTTQAAPPIPMPPPRPASFGPRTPAAPAPVDDGPDDWVVPESWSPPTDQPQATAGAPDDGPDDWVVPESWQPTQMAKPDANGFMPVAGTTPEALPLEKQAPYRDSLLGTWGATRPAPEKPLTPDEIKQREQQNTIGAPPNPAEIERQQRVDAAHAASASATEALTKARERQPTLDAAEAQRQANIENIRKTSGDRAARNYAARTGGLAAPSDLDIAKTNQESAIKAQIEQNQTPAPVMTPLRNAADATIKAVADGARTTARLAAELGSYTSRDPGGVTKEEIDELSENAKKVIDGMLPGDAARKNDFWAQKVPEGFGSSLSFLVMGAAGKAVGLSDAGIGVLIAATGAAQQAGSEVEKFDAAIKRYGKSLDTVLGSKDESDLVRNFSDEKESLRSILGPKAYEAAAAVIAGHYAASLGVPGTQADQKAYDAVRNQLMAAREGLDHTAIKRMVVLFANAGIGATEAIPIANALERVNALSGGSVARIAKAGGINSLEEMVQEAFQNWSTNEVTHFVYDLAQTSGEGVWDATSVAAMIGLLQGGGIQAYHETLKRGAGERGLPPPPPNAPLPPLNTPPSGVIPPPSTPPQGTQTGTQTAPDLVDPMDWIQEDTTARAERQKIINPPAEQQGAQAQQPKTGVVSEAPEPVSDVERRILQKHGLTDDEIGGLSRAQIDEAIDRSADPEKPVENGQKPSEPADDTYAKAVALVRAENRGSTSYLQRKLGIPTYGEAAAIMDRLEADGVVGPADHAGKRSVIPQGAREATPIGTAFTTAKGSTYEVHDDGTTTRNKAYRPEHGAKEQGPQPRSEKTVYVDAKKIGAFAIPQDTSWRIADHGDGTMSFVTRNPNGKWGVAPESKNIKVHDAPAVGLTPLELWGKERLTPHNLDAYSKMHPGNEITKVSQPGTREAPVKLETKEDVQQAAAAARDDGTHAQHEAGNIQLGHGEWEGMGLTFEVRAGGTRKGVTPEGKPYESHYGTDYGRFKGLPPGGDGQAPDFYMGPNPKSKSVFVIDEVDDKTGAFRQTKAMLGFDTQQQAVDGYLGTSTKSEDGIGGVREFTPDEFKQLAKDGGLSKPTADAWVDLKHASNPGEKTDIAESTPAKPEHVAAIDAAIRTVGDDPAKVDPETKQAILDIHVNEGAPPEQAVLAAQIRALVNEGKLDEDIARGELGNEARILDPGNAPGDVEAPEKTSASPAGETAAGESVRGEKRDQAGAQPPRQNSNAKPGGKANGPISEAPAASRPAQGRGGVNTGAANAEPVGATKVGNGGQGERSGVSIHAQVKGATPEEAKSTKAKPEPSTPKAPETGPSVSVPALTVDEASRNLEAARANHIKQKKRLDGMDTRIENMRAVKPKNALHADNLKKQIAQAENFARIQRRKEAEAMDAVDDAKKALKAVQEGAKTTPVSEEIHPITEKPKRAAAPADVEIPEFLRRGKLKAEAEAAPKDHFSEAREQEALAEGSGYKKTAAGIWVKGAGDLRLSVWRDWKAGGTEPYRWSALNLKSKQAGSGNTSTFEAAHAAAEAAIEAKPVAESNLQEKLAGSESQEAKPESPSLNEKPSPDVSRAPSDVSREAAKDDGLGDILKGMVSKKFEEKAAVETKPEPKAERKREFPGYTNEKLREVLAEPKINPKMRERVEAELAARASEALTEHTKSLLELDARESGKSKSKVTPTPFNDHQARVIHNNLRDKGAARVAGVDYKIVDTNNGFGYEQVKDGVRTSHGPDSGTWSRLEAIEAADYAIFGAAQAAEAKPKTPQVPNDAGTKYVLPSFATAQHAKPRTAAQAGKSAAKNAGMGLADFAKGFDTLFNPKGKLTSGGISFDSETYANAKPLFKAGLAHFAAAGRDIVEMMRQLVDYLVDTAKMDEATMTAASPYILQFVRDVRDGKESLDVDRGSEQAGAVGEGGVGEAGSEVADGKPAGNERSGELGNQPADNARGNEKAPSGEGTGPRSDGSVSAGGETIHQGGNAANGRKGAGGKGVATPGTGGRPEHASLRPNYHIADPERLVGGGPKARFARNKAAIEAFRAITDEGRDPTAEELDAMAGYMGWGSFGQELFQGNWERPRPKEDWAKEDKWLREHLGEPEWKGAQSSIINAHYTDPPTVKAMWGMARAMGFTGGRVLEPSMGIGNFFGLMPRDMMGESQLTGIELDPLTGGMAKLLYPHANIQIKPYQDSKTGDNFYDMVIGNWPFAAQAPADRRYAHLNASLHDFFFVKALDQVRPGGIIMGITSSGTMDKVGKPVRIHLAKNAELVASFRLPSGAFEKYAGTSVVTDIIILKKREKPILETASSGWIESRDKDVKDGTIRVNEYWDTHPDNVLGTLAFGHGTTQGREGMIVDRAADFPEKLSTLQAKVPPSTYAPVKRGGEARFITNDTKDRQSSIVHKGGKLYQVQGERLVLLEDVVKYKTVNKKETAKREHQIATLAEMRKLYDALLASERNGSDTTTADRTSLRDYYNRFVATHGPIVDSDGITIMKRAGDPGTTILLALETPQGKPARIMSESTTRSKKVLEKPTVRDAFVLQRNESTKIDMARIAEAAGVSAEDAADELQDSNAIYRTPGGGFEVSDIYLSGNVRRKLREAIDAREGGERDLDKSIEALQKVIPPDVPYYKIEAKLGATWVPNEDYVAFISGLLGVQPSDAITVDFTGGRWKVKFGDQSYNYRPEAQTQWGVERHKYPFNKLLSAAMGNVSVTIKTKDADGNLVTDESATKEANEKVARIREEFSGWVWKETGRKVRLERSYNDVMRAIATPKFDGSFLDFSGMALQKGTTPFSLRQHQVNAIWRGIVNRSGLYAHEVGTGKTTVMGGLAVESRRYGIARKPLLLAHNANSASVAAEIQEMYPGSKVLYVDNLTPSTLEVTMRRIANDDWDVVVVPHSVIDRFALSEETLNAMMAEDIAALEQEAMEAAQEDSASLKVADMDSEDTMKKLRSPTAKQLVKQRNQIKEKIKQMAQRASREGAIKFEDLGIDMILVDEVHEFKKPPITTKMKMRGLNTGTSDRSIALRFLTDYVKSINGGRGVHVFTGTPITNTLAEIYNMQRYVMSDVMALDGLKDWDSWFNTFADSSTDVELTATGEYEAVTRLASFVNVADLRQMIGQYMDIVFADDMPEFKPRAINGKTMASADLNNLERDELVNGRTENAIGRPYKKVVNDIGPMSPEQQGVLAHLAQLAKDFRDDTKKGRRERMLSGHESSPILVETAAANAGLDARLYQMDAPDHPQNKVNRTVKNVVGHYKESDQSTQVIFVDRGYGDSATRTAGRNDAGDKIKVKVAKFNLVQSIVDKLVENGIPRHQIAIVDGKVSKGRRKEIADKMNSAEVRVVIGNSDTLGVGVNMQRNLRAMHHMDAPWMPGELEQRNGRGWRQGNQWNTVFEYRYITEKLDGRRWQVLAVKDRFIKSFLTADEDVRVIEGDAVSMDEGESAADLMSTLSAAAGDPRLLVKNKLESDIKRLQQRERQHAYGIEDAKTEVGRIERRIKAKQEEADKLTQYAENVTEARGDGEKFSATIKGKEFPDRKTAGAALDEAVKKIVKGETENIGKVYGFPIEAEWSQFVDEPYYRIVTKTGYWPVRPSLASIEAVLRNFAKKAQEAYAEVEDMRGSQERLQASTKEPFAQAKQLADKKAQLAALEADMSRSPVIAPSWLRQGTPIDTKLWVRDGDKLVDRVVQGHRWGDADYYVATDKGDVPYLDALDENGMRIYDPRPFQPPVSNQASTPPQTGAPSGAVSDSRDAPLGPTSSALAIGDTQKLPSLHVIRVTSDLAAERAFIERDLRDAGVDKPTFFEPYQPDFNSPERIDKAATLYRGKVYTGPIHSDAVGKLQEDQGLTEGKISEDEFGRHYEKMVQGFLTTHGNFIGRVEAASRTGARSDEATYLTAEKPEVGPARDALGGTSGARAVAAEPERIVGATVIVDGRIFIGHNHALAIDEAKKAIPGYQPSFDPHHKGGTATGGFITSHGRLVSREDAYNLVNGEKAVKGGRATAERQRGLKDPENKALADQWQGKPISEFNPVSPRLKKGDATGPSSLTPEAEARKEHIASGIRGIIRHLVGRDVEVRFVDDVGIPDNGKDHGWGEYGDKSPTVGLYNNLGRRIITLALRHEGVFSIAFHESYHDIESVLQDDHERALMASPREMDRLRQIVQKARGFTDEEMAGIVPHEIRAIAFELYSMSRVKGGTGAEFGIHVGVRRFFEKLMRLLRAARNMLNGMGFQTAEDVFGKAFEGKYAQQPVLRQYAEDGGIVAGLPEASAPVDRDAPLGPTAGAAAMAPRRPARRAPTVPQLQPLHHDWRAALRDPTMPRLQRLSAAFDAMMLNPSRALWDKIIDVSRLQQASEMMKGQPTPQSQDTHQAMILFAGRAGERLKDSTYELFNPIWDALKEHNISRPEFNDFLYARHAHERNAEIRTIDPNNDSGSGITDDEADDILDQINNAGRRNGFDAVAAMADNIVVHNRDVMLGSGLESRQTLTAWSTKYQHYVPLKGSEISDEEYPATPSRGAGFNVRGPESRRALGRFDKAGDIMANLMDQTMRTIIRAEKNKVDQTFARFAIANPSPLYKIGLSEARRQINPQTGMVHTATVTTSANSDYVLNFKVAGDAYHIKFDPSADGLLLALKNLGVPRMSAGMQLVNSFTRAYSTFQTAKNPDFVFTNLIRDIQDAGIALTAEQQAGFVKAYLKNLTSGRSFLSAVLGTVGSTNNRYGQLYEQWREDGGKISFFGWKDISDIVGDMNREMTRRTESMAKKVVAQPWRTVDPFNGHVVKLFEAMSDVTESTTRLAVYAAGLEVGLTRPQAAAAARAMTIDFNRGGKYSHLIKALWAFSGPQVQGTVNLGRRLRSSAKFRRVMIGGVAGMSYLLTLWNNWASPPDDDDDKKNIYEQLKYWERQKNIIVYFPGQKKPILTIPFDTPTPFGFRLPLGYMLMPFWMMGENAAMLTLGKIGPGKALWNWIGSAAQTFNPLGAEGSALELSYWLKTVSPTIVDPFFELFRNSDWLDRPIHPSEMPWNRGVPHSEQSKVGTNPYAEDMAQWVNRLTGGNHFKKGKVDLYPDDIEYVWNFALGGYGRFLGNTFGMGRNIIEGVDTPVEKIPFVRNFVAPGNREQIARSDYYEKRNEAKEQTATARRANQQKREGNNVEEAEKTIDEMKSKIGMRIGARGGVSSSLENEFKHADKQLKELREEDRMLRRNPTISRAERSIRLRENRAKQLEEMRGPRKTFRELQTAP